MVDTADMSQEERDVYWSHPTHAPQKPFETLGIQD
jgi:hypothetical protein